MSAAPDENLHKKYEKNQKQHQKNDSGLTTESKKEESHIELDFSDSKRKQKMNGELENLQRIQCYKIEGNKGMTWNLIYTAICQEVESGNSETNKFESNSFKREHKIKNAPFEIPLHINGSNDNFRGKKETEPLVESIFVQRKEGNDLLVASEINKETNVSLKNCLKNNNEVQKMNQETSLAAGNINDKAKNCLVHYSQVKHESTHSSKGFEYKTENSEKTEIYNVVKDNFQDKNLIQTSDAPTLGKKICDNFRKILKGNVQRKQKIRKDCGKINPENTVIKTWRGNCESFSLGAIGKNEISKTKVIDKHMKVTHKNEASILRKATNNNVSKILAENLQKKRRKRIGCLKVLRKNGLTKSKAGTNNIEPNVLQKETGLVSFNINAMISEGKKINNNLKKVVESDDVIQEIENKNNDSEVRCSKAFVSATHEQNEEENKTQERNAIKNDQMKDTVNVKGPELGLSINTNFRKLLKGNIEKKSKTLLDVEKIRQQNGIVESICDSESAFQVKEEIEENKNICPTIISSSENTSTIVITTEGHQQPVQQPEEHIDQQEENNLGINNYVTSKLGSARRNDDINVSDALQEENETTIDNGCQALVKKIGDNLNKIFINSLQKSNDESTITSDDDMEIDEESDSSESSELNSEYETSDSEENENVCISCENEETQPMDKTIEQSCKEPGKCCTNEARRSSFQKRKICLHFTRKKETNKLIRRKRSVKQRNELARKRDRERKLTARRNQTMEQREMERLKGRLRKRRLRIRKRQQEIFDERLRRQVATWRVNCSVEENMLEFIRKYTRRKEKEVSD